MQEHNATQSKEGADKAPSAPSERSEQDKQENERPAREVARDRLRRDPDQQQR